jgi:isoquinoline 1-oxidoreductase beta subunit
MLRDISQDPTTARTLQGAGHVEIQNISRRGFLGVSGTAFALALFPAPVQAFTRFKVGGSSMPQGLREDPLLFVSLTADGLVTVIVHRSEMGQGIRTSFAMVIADELGADWAQMRVRQAPGDEPKYGNQDTDGSRSMRHHIQALRYMGAAMRQMLINAAAAEWGVDASQVSAGVNEIKSASRSARFGELAAGAMQQPVPRFEDLTFKT